MLLVISFKTDCGYLYQLPYRGFKMNTICVKNTIYCVHSYDNKQEGEKVVS